MKKKDKNNSNEEEDAVGDIPPYNHHHSAGSSSSFLNSKKKKQQQQHNNNYLSFGASIDMFVKQYFSNENEIKKPEHVSLSTIHQAKGMLCYLFILFCFGNQDTTTYLYRFT